MSEIQQAKKMNIELYLFALHLLFSMLTGFVSFPETIISIAQYTFICFGLIRIVRKRYLYISSFFKWGLAYIAVMIISLLYSPDRGVAFTVSILPYTIQFVIFLILYYEMHEFGETDHVMKIYAFCGILFSMICLTLHSSEIFSGRRFGYSLGRNPNEIMLQLIIPASLFLYWGLYQSKLYIAGFAICVLVMISTGSKKSILIFLFVLLMLFFRPENSRRKLITIFIILLLVVASYYAVFNVSFLYDTIGERIELMLYATRGGYISGYSSDIERAEMRKTALSMFLKSPLWGNGCESFRVLSGYCTYSHNNYCEFLCNYGVFGTLVYYSLPLVCLVNLIKKFYFVRERSDFLSLLLSLIIVYFIIDYGAVTVAIKYSMTLFVIISVWLDNKGDFINSYE